MLATLLFPCSFLIAPPQQLHLSTCGVRAHNQAAVTGSSRSGLAGVRCDLPNIDGTGAFKNIQEYPCDLDIKVIGSNEGPFVQDIVQLAAENTGMKIEDIQVRWRDNGKYRAITMRLHFENSDQVYATYAAMDRDPRVKFKL